MKGTMFLLLCLLIVEGAVGFTSPISFNRFVSHSPRAFATPKSPIWNLSLLKMQTGGSSKSRKEVQGPYKLRSDASVEELMKTIRIKDVSKEVIREMLSPAECPSIGGLRVILIGPPSCGKSILAPLLAAKYQIDVLSVTDLPNDDALVDRVLDRLSRTGRDKGFVLLGFPRTAAQARALARRGIEVDLVVELERNEEEALKWREGRLVDPETGLVYHMELSPPPSEVAGRVVCVVKDSPQAFEDDVKNYMKRREAIRAFYADEYVSVDAGLSRSMLEVMKATIEVVDKICPVEARNNPLLAGGEMYKFVMGAGKGIKEGGLLSHVQGLNTYNQADFMEFKVDDQQVGWVRQEFAKELEAASRACGIKAFKMDYPVCDLDGGSTGGMVTLSDDLCKLSLTERSEKLNVVMKYMWEAGVIRGWRGELQNVAMTFNSDPVLLLERGAMPYFGVASYGVHVNVFVRERETVLMWIARRAKNKPTYPGLLDQCVAGGQPADLDLATNVFKECIEEASISVDVARRACPVGAVRYMYETRKGMSPKTLFCYDLEVPASFVPVNSDGEVDEFMRIPLAEVVESISNHPEEWKPNSALVALDFAVRHGAINGDTEPDYLDILAGLRGSRHVENAIVEMRED